ncbi:MAG: non-homologous end-joining DNA ligase [Gemmatimonadetes bacterium]|nr:non-homologous end-joining DNA ligase [Gemmatimonadota bacterium]
MPAVGDHPLEVGDRSLRLTSLDKTFWPDGGWTKGDLLRWYATAAEALLPHVVGRPIVMKRYPDGIDGKSFFMKRTPSHAPEWLITCSIEHASGSVIDFAVVDDAAALLWLVQIGCISLHPWPARCDAVDRPDFLTFDLDPVEGADFGDVREAALVVGRTLAGLGAEGWAKTSGSRGIHVFVPIQRGPEQKAVWRVAKSLSLSLEALHPDLLTAVYRKADRPKGRVLVDYNQNAWGRTLASVYSVRPRPGAPVSAPVTWEELEEGIEPLDFTIDSLPARLEERGDLWSGLLEEERRFRLESLHEEAGAAPD